MQKLSIEMVSPANSQSNEDNGPWLRTACRIPGEIAIIMLCSFQRFGVKPSIVEPSFVKPSVKKFGRRLAEFYGCNGCTRTLIRICHKSVYPYGYASENSGPPQSIDSFSSFQHRLKLLPAACMAHVHLK
jgi:hypothetical protein